MEWQMREEEQTRLTRVGKRRTESLARVANMWWRILIPSLSRGWPEAHQCIKECAMHYRPAANRASFTLSSLSSSSALSLCGAFV